MQKIQDSSGINEIEIYFFYSHKRTPEVGNPRLCMVWRMREVPRDNQGKRLLWQTFQGCDSDLEIVSGQQEGEYWPQPAHCVGHAQYAHCVGHAQHACGACMYYFSLIHPTRYWLSQ